MKAQIDQIKDIISRMDMAIIEEYLPGEIIEEYKKQSQKQYRERIYGLNQVVTGLIFQAMSEDKSEQNAVIFLSEYYKRLREQINQVEEKFTRSQAGQSKKKQGRPRKGAIKIQKSKVKEISLNTSSYNEARQRLPIDLMQALFKGIKPKSDKSRSWHGHNVLIADGSTVKTVDTKQLRDKFMPGENNLNQPLPMLRIEVLIDMFDGHVFDFEIGSYSSSEGKMLRKLYPRIPGDAVIMADDYYSGYGHFAYCLAHGINLIAQGKHYRNEKVVQSLSRGDEIVEWKSHQKPRWFEKEDELPDTIQLRRISFTNPLNKNNEITIYTTLMDEKQYNKQSIIELDKNRWDIEVGFNEIKTVLDMEYLRAKTVEMVIKEILAYMILYNIIRILIADILDKHNVDFFFNRETIQTRNSVHKTKDSYIDRLGRSYYKKSPGRYASIHN